MKHLITNSFKKSTIGYLHSLFQVNRSTESSAKNHVAALLLSPLVLVHVVLWCEDRRENCNSNDADHQNSYFLSENKDDSWYTFYLCKLKCHRNQGPAYILSVLGKKQEQRLNLFNFFTSSLSLMYIVMYPAQVQSSCICHPRSVLVSSTHKKQIALNNYCLWPFVCSQVPLITYTNYEVHLQNAWVRLKMSNMVVCLWCSCWTGWSNSDGQNSLYH